MDGLLLRKHVNFLLIFICAILQLARSLPYPGQFSVTREQNRLQVPGYTRTPVFQRFVPYQRSPSQSWGSRSYNLNRPELQIAQNRVSDRQSAQSQGFDRQFSQNRVSDRQFRDNVRPRTRTHHERLPSYERSRPSHFRTYIRQIDLQRPRRLQHVQRTRPIPYNPEGRPKISVVNGPLSQVVQHPKPRNMKEQHRMGYRVVAKAKSFPGILKDTSLDVTTV